MQQKIQLNNTNWTEKPGKFHLSGWLGTNIEIRMLIERLSQIDPCAVAHISEDKRITMRFENICEVVLDRITDNVDIRGPRVHALNVLYIPSTVISARVQISSIYENRKEGLEFLNQHIEGEFSYKGDGITGPQVSGLIQGANIPVLQLQHKDYAYTKTLVVLFNKQTKNLCKMQVSPHNLSKFGDADFTNVKYTEVDVDNTIGFVLLSNNVLVTETVFRQSSTIKAISGFEKHPFNGRAHYTTSTKIVRQELQKLVEILGSIPENFDSFETKVCVMVYEMVANHNKD